jgi:hypothetical protein
MSLNYIQEARQVKTIYMTGAITYDEAIARLRPILAKMDAVAERIAKEYGKKHYKFNPIKFLR